MSQENVELVRAMLEDFRAGKLEFDADGMLTKMTGEEAWDPDIEWDASEVQGLAEQRVENLRRIFEKADHKLGSQPQDRSGAVPPRVLKGIYDEGSFMDDELGAEYLGGVLASSRTETPRDDRSASTGGQRGRAGSSPCRHQACSTG